MVVLFVFFFLTSTTYGCNDKKLLQLMKSFIHEIWKIFINVIVIKYTKLFYILLFVTYYQIIIKR